MQMTRAMMTIYDFLLIYSKHFHIGLSFAVSPVTVAHDWAILGRFDSESTERTNFVKMNYKWYNIEHRKWIIDHQEEHEVMFHVSTMLPFNKDDCQQVRNGFGGYEVKHGPLGWKSNIGFYVIPHLDILPSQSATTVFLLIALILPGGAKTSHRQRHSQHYLCRRGAHGYGTI